MLSSFLFDCFISWQDYEIAVRSIWSRQSVTRMCKPSDRYKTPVSPPNSERGATKDLTLPNPKPRKQLRLEKAETGKPGWSLLNLQSVYDQTKKKDTKQKDMTNQHLPLFSLDHWLQYRLQYLWRQNPPPVLSPRKWNWVLVRRIVPKSSEFMHWLYDPMPATLVSRQPSGRRRQHWWTRPPPSHVPPNNLFRAPPNSCKFEQICAIFNNLCTCLPGGLCTCVYRHLCRTAVNPLPLQSHGSSVSLGSSTDICHLQTLYLPEVLPHICNNIFQQNHGLCSKTQMYKLMLQILDPHWPFAFYRNDSTLTGPCTRSKVSEGMPVGSAPCNGLLHLENIFLSTFQLYFPPSLRPLCLINCTSPFYHLILNFSYNINCISVGKKYERGIPIGSALCTDLHLGGYQMGGKKV